MPTFTTYCKHMFLVTNGPTPGPRGMTIRVRCVLCDKRHRWPATDLPLTLGEWKSPEWVTWRAARWAAAGVRRHGRTTFD